MAHHKRDLRTDGLVGNCANIVLVFDRSEIPVLKTVFVNGQEVNLPVDQGPTVEANDSDLTTVTLPLVAGRLETITESQMEDRLIKE